MLNLIKSTTALPSLRPAINRTLGWSDTWGVIVTSCTRHDGTVANRGWSGQSNYAVNLIVQGTGQLIPSEGPPLPLAPGVAYQHFPTPAQSPALVWDAGQDIIEWYVTLDRRLHERLAPTGLFPTEHVLKFTHPDPASFYISHYERILPLGDQSGTRRLHRMLAETVYFLGRLFDTARPAETTGRWAPIINDARDWLDLNPASRAPLPQLAHRLGVSYASLRREFQTATGQSLTTYRIARRIEEAKARLIHRDVATTAAELGYPDPFTFSAQFKKATGLSPRAYLQGGATNNT